MLEILVGLGFTEEQGKMVIEILGIETESDLKHLKEADLTEKLGMKPVPARRILEAAGVTSGVDSREITVRLDRGEVAVADMQNPEDLLSVLAADGRTLFDKKSAAGKLAVMGRSVVVKKSDRKELLVDDTRNFWRYGSSRSRFWGPDDNPVVGAPSLFETNEQVEVDPYELVHRRRLAALVGGYNAESGADWAKVTMPRRALLIAAALDRETVAGGDSVDIAEALSAEVLSGKWRVLEGRIDKERLTKLQGCLVAPLADINTPESAGTSAIIVAVFDDREEQQEAFSMENIPSWKTPEVVLQDFFTLAFSEEEMDDVAPEVNDGVQRIGVSKTILMFNFVRAFRQRGYLKHTFFWEKLMKLRPLRREEVRFLAAMYKIQL